MKKYILIISACMLSLFATAQTTNYKVVFDMTSKDSVNQQSLLRELSFIRGSNPAAKLEVVVYSQGLDIVLKDKPSQPAVEKLLMDKDITFKVCAMTMKRNNINKEQLVPGVQVVPDGIYEIVSKQQEGWGYIKVSH